MSKRSAPSSTKGTSDDPVAACRTFTAEDACRYALAAYYAASRESEPPPGEDFFSEGVPWSDRRTFRERFVEILQERVLIENIYPEDGFKTEPMPGESWLDFIRRENDSLPLPENHADNQLGSALEC